MTQQAGLKRAKFVPQTGGEPFDVHFNPVSLDYTITNTLKEEGRGNAKKQHVSQSSGKLTMELVFDTTHNGEDVRIHTEKVARLMEPAKDKTPPIVSFEWGTYKFPGMVETFKEKIDFFSPEGVPLRSTVNITLAKQDKVFETEGKKARTNVHGRVAVGDVAEVKAPPDAPLTKTTSKGGDAAAARAVGAFNGVESLRLPGLAVLSVSADITLSPPTAFASGSLSVDASVVAGLSFSGSASLGLGGSVGGASGGGSIGGSRGGGSIGGSSSGVAIGGSSGTRPGISSGASASAASGAGDDPAVRSGIAKLAAVAPPPPKTRNLLHPSSARVTVDDGAAEGDMLAPRREATMDIDGSGAPREATERGGVSANAGAAAGVPATERAFEALRSARSFRRHHPMDLDELLRPVDGGYPSGTGVGFRVGGQATMIGAASLSADVGRKLNLRDRIRFKGD